MTTDRVDLDAIAGRFEAFARDEVHGNSPLYEALCLAIARAPWLLELATHCRAGQAQPNLLLAAIHHLVRRDPAAGLARYYADVVKEPVAPDAALPEALSAFCAAHRDAIIGLVATRLVQTNEPRRSAALLLALDAIRRRHGIERLALIEVGTSAGLNLLFERYRFDLGYGRVVNPGGAPEIVCEVGGQDPAAIPAPPRITSITGVDLNPIAADDPEEVDWLRSLVWPEQSERWTLLADALAVSATHPPRFERGDAFEVLPRLVAELPADEPVCVFHSATLAHFDPADRLAFAELLRSLATTRDLYWLSMENAHVTGLFEAPASAAITGGYFVLGLVHLSDPEAQPVALAAVNPHARWIEWWASEAPAE